jgi:hypothetical protein
MPPTQIPGELDRMLMSALLMGHVLPPKETATFRFIAQAVIRASHQYKGNMSIMIHVQNPQNPSKSPVKGSEPGTAAQKLVTSAVGPPIRVEPLSKADIAVAAVTLIDFPLMLRPSVMMRSGI